LSRIINMATEPQVQSAMGNFQNGNPILLASATVKRPAGYGPK
jgi:hypothetical protein